MNFFRKIRKSIYNSKNNESGIDSEAIFSLSSATITLETKLGLKSTGRCALTIKSTSGMYFKEMKEEIQRFLAISKPDLQLDYRTVVDSYGYLWLIFAGRSIEDALAATTAVVDTIQEKGFSSQILASIFEFQQVPELERSSEKNNYRSIRYLVYNYKSNKFYPFVPFFGERSRNTEDEMRIMATLQKEISFEKDMGVWYPLWDIPL